MLNGVAAGIGSEGVASDIGDVVTGSDADLNATIIGFDGRAAREGQEIGRPRAGDRERRPGGCVGQGEIGCIDIRHIFAEPGVPGYRVAICVEGCRAMAANAGRVGGGGVRGRREGASINGKSAQCPVEGHCIPNHDIKTR